MSVEYSLAKAFGLSSEDAWRRHANPWSVYTRIPIPVLLAIAIWSRAWIGWWSLIPVAVVIAWTAVNPRVFPAPRSLDHWASRSVLGETTLTTILTPTQRCCKPIPLGRSLIRPKAPTTRPRPARGKRPPGVRASSDADADLHVYSRSPGRPCLTQRRIGCPCAHFTDRPQ